MSVSVRKRSVSDFVIGDCIGEGSYSRVFRAISKTNKKTYAIKILNKQHIHQEQKRKYVTIEKDTLNLLGKHDGIVTLYYTFQDSKRLYFVIDYASNGELLGLIHKYGNLCENIVKYYSIQLIDTLSFIHSKGVIHRDLKPENILLNSEWKIMITDFGAAKVQDLPIEQSNELQEPNELYEYIEGEETETEKEEENEVCNNNNNNNSSNRKGSFVGTAEYVTPELLERNECGFESDYWALGCIIYQMIIGRPPFKESSEYETFLKIINLDYKFPIDCPIPKLLEDLIENLLKLDPNERLKLNQIKNHKWFKGIKWGDWRTIWGQRVPKFEKYDPNQLLVLSEIKSSSLNLKREIDNNKTNKKLMDKVITRSKLPSPINTNIAQCNNINNNGVPWVRKSPITSIPEPKSTTPTMGQIFFPPQRKVSSDAISAAGAVSNLMNKNKKNQSPIMVNPILLDKEVPKVIKDKLLLNEKILKLDNILKSELSFKPNQFVKRGEPLTDEILQNVIKRNEFILDRNLKVCILVITSSARLFIYELDSGGDGIRNHNSLTMMHARDFYSNMIEIKLTNNLISLYDYEFDEDSKDGYLILELNNVNKLIFLSNWDRNMIVKGGLNLNVRVGFKIGENDSWINTLLKAKNMLKNNKR